MSFVRLPYTERLKYLFFFYPTKQLKATGFAQGPHGGNLEALGFERLSDQRLN